MAIQLCHQCERRFERAPNNNVCGRCGKLVDFRFLDFGLVEGGDD